MSIVDEAGPLNPSILFYSEQVKVHQNVMPRFHVIDRTSPTPLYYQIVNYLSAKISDEQLQPGDPLPSEAQLITQFGVSRITVRHAMAHLEFEGLIERRQGKGAYVSQPKLVHRQRLLRPLEEDLQAQGHSTAFEFISYTKMDPSPKVQRALRCDASQPVYLLQRLKLVDKEQLAIETRFFHERIGRQLERRSLLLLPIYRLLETVLGRYPRRLVETMSVSVTTEDEARHLRVAVGFPVLVNDHTMFDDEDNPVEFGKTVFRGDRYQIYLESWRDRLAEPRSLSV